MYIEKASADAADPKPEHVTPPRAVHETNDVTNQLSGHTLSRPLGAPWRDPEVPGCPWGSLGILGCPWGAPCVVTEGSLGGPSGHWGSPGVAGGP